MKNFFTLFVILMIGITSLAAHYQNDLLSKNYVQNPARSMRSLIPWMYDQPQEMAMMMATCPSDVTIDLDPEECSAVADFDWTFPPLVPPPSDTTFSQNTSNLITGTKYCPTGPTTYTRSFFNGKYTDIRINQISLGVYSSINNPIVTVRFTNMSGTEIFGSHQYNIPSPSSSLVNLVPGGIIKIPARSNFKMEVISSQPGVSAFMLGRVTEVLPNEAAISSCSGFNEINSSANSFYFTFTATPDDYRIVNTSASPLNQLNSGSSFPIGTSDMTYTIYEPTGATTLCSFSVTVNEFDEATGAIACNDEVKVSVDVDCEAVITPDMLLEGDDYGCLDNYTVVIYAKNGQPIGDKVTRAHVGQKLKTQIFGPNGNSCWGEIIIEDKHAPVLECDTVYATCGTDLTPGSLLSEIVPVAAHITDGSIGTGANQFSIPVASIEGSTITDVDVYLNISHDRISDLAAEIISPDGITVPLFLQQAGCDFPDLDVTFDSDAVSDISCDASSLPAIGGRFKARASLDVFNGANMGGIWRVRIYDLVGGVDGTVNDIHLIFSQTGGEIPFPTSNKIQVTEIDDNSYLVRGLDACSNTTLSYEDVIVKETCDSIFDRIIKRCWTAKDGAGNVSTCCQFIYVYRNSLSTIVFPADFDGLNGNPEPLSCEIFGDSIPPVEHTGVPDGDFCSKTQLLPVSDVRIDICPKSYKLLRTHKVLDWCTGAVIVHHQVIKVLDDDGPELECPPNITLSTDNYTCSATYIVPSPLIKKECSGAKSYRLEHRYNEVPGSEFGTTGVNQATRTIAGLPLGSNTIRWIVTDSCDNSSMCTFNVTVIDNDRPTAVCDIFTVASITGGGRAIVEAETFDDGSHDNCGILKFEARKMTDRCRFGTVNFTPTVEFCCEEVNTSVMVEMRVTDVHGNTNTCMVEVRIQDKLPPYITKCPADITLECQADHRDTSITGWPEYIDNCAVDSVWFKDTDSITQCGTGIVTRTFTVKDKQNLRHSCVQVITLIDSDPFWVNRQNPEDPTDDIIWPRNYSTNKCFSKLHPDSLPVESRRPRWNDDHCSLVAAHYKDQIFKFADGACEKILRTWTVIDWCTYKEEYENHYYEYGYVPGKYEYIQIIKLQNDVPPQFEFACIDRIVPSYGDSCRENVKFTMSAIDDCPEGNDSIKWRYELFTKNGVVPIAVVNSKTFERILNNGEYRVKWIIEDRCGNQAICEHKLTLVESKKPTPYCITSLTTAVMNNNGTVEIWAKDYDQGGFDNCTHKDSIWFTFFDALPVDSLLYREHYFKGNGNLATKAEYEAGNAQIWKPVQKSSGMFFDCSDIPNGKSQQISLNVTLTDEARNQDYCTIQLLLQDNSNTCPDVNQIVAGVNGRVTSNSSAKPNTQVIIEGNVNEFPKTIRTDADGQYAFNSLPANYNYSVRMEDDNDILNGVSTLDLVMIQRHILGLEEFNDARKVIAADVDNSQKITAADLVALRKVILGITNNFPNGQKSWRFATADLSTQAASSPFPYNEKYVYQNLNEVKTNQNFFAIKIGDINHSAKVNVNDSQVEPRSNSTLALETEVSEVSGSDEIVMPVYAASFENVLGYQFTLHFDPQNLNFIEMIPGAIGLKDQNFGYHMVEKGLISTSWHTEIAEDIDITKPLFTLKFRIKGDIKNPNPLTLSSVITNAEAYDDQLSKMVIKLKHRSKSTESDQYALGQNIPNPFTENTQVSFTLPSSSMAKLTITDISGKVIKVIEKEFEKGENHVILNKNELGTSGILLYKLESGSFTDTRKMIILE